MKINTINVTLGTQKAQTLLVLGTAASLVVIHLVVLNQVNDSEIFATSILLWAAVASLIWDKRKTLPLGSGTLSSILGTFLVALVLLRTLSPAGYHLRISPAMSFLGLCLLTSGVKKLHYYWKELIILSLLALEPFLRLMLESIDLSTITAKFASFSLWYAGLETYREGRFILLPGGRVEVYGACSGMSSMIQMFNIAILFILMIPTRWYQKILCITVAVLIGFLVNVIRVDLLAILVAGSHQEAFDYWHGGAGSLVFFVASVLLFWLFCWVSFLRHTPDKIDGKKS